MVRTGKNLYFLLTSYIYYYIENHYHFFKKSGFITFFSLLKPNFMQKIREKSDEPVPVTWGYKQTDRLTDIHTDRG